jgi:hypothetical protein
MKIELFKGHIQDASGTEREAWCARSDFGVRAVCFDEPAEVRIAEQARVAASDHITSLELPGLNREDLEFLLDVILQGGYLARPGVRDSGEAVLFMVVNEALHALDRVAAWESEDSEEP